MHHAPGTVHHAPCTVRHAPCTMHRAPCTMHHAPCTSHRAQVSLAQLEAAIGSADDKGRLVCLKCSPPLRTNCPLGTRVYTHCLQHVSTYTARQVLCPVVQVVPHHRQAAVRGAVYPLRGRQHLGTRRRLLRGESSISRVLLVPISVLTGCEYSVYCRC